MAGRQPRDPDRVIALDWSASSRPVVGANSIWIGMASGARPTEVRNIATRRDAERLLADEIGASIAARETLLIGCDAGLGYPAGSAGAFGVGESAHPGSGAWRATWELIESELVDDDNNRNNRFEVAARLNATAQRRGVPAGPFWGVPRSAVVATLSSTKPRVAGPGVLAEFRLTESELRRKGRRPHSMWQLLGAGSVGSQSLTLIPVLERLRRTFPDAVAVWPYEHDRIGSGSASVVIAEMWPTMFGLDEAIESQLCRDAGQVYRMAEVAVTQGGGWLAVPDDAPECTLVEEGWVLGVAWPSSDKAPPDSARNGEPTVRSVG